MPVGQRRFSGNLGGGIGKTTPTAGAALLARGAAKMGIGGRGSAVAAEPAPDPELGKALRGAFGIPAAKRTSKGRQNQPVAKGSKRDKVAMSTGAPTPKAKSKSRPG